MTSTSFRDGVPYVGGIGQDIARGILPVASVFDTDPSNLKYITDGDIGSVSGTGETALGAAANYGMLELDFGIEKAVQICTYMTAWSLANTHLTLYCDVWDGSAFQYGGQALYSVTSTIERRLAIPVQFASTQKIRFRLYAAGADTFYAKFYEILALEVLP